MDRFDYTWGAPPPTAAGGRVPLPPRALFNETPEAAFARKHGDRFGLELFEIIRLRQEGCHPKEIRSRMKKYKPPPNKYTQLKWDNYGFDNVSAEHPLAQPPDLSELQIREDQPSRVQV